MNNLCKIEIKMLSRLSINDAFNTNVMKHTYYNQNDFSTLSLFTNHFKSSSLSLNIST